MNPSGISPVEFNVLVKQDATEEKTKGGLILHTDTQERDKHSQIFGTIIALSPMAFNADVWPVEYERPKPGQRVAFAKHSGAFIKGLDGEEYRVVKDKDVVAIIDG